LRQRHEHISVVWTYTAGNSEFATAGHADFADDCSCEIFDGHGTQLSPNECTASAFSSPANAKLN
jgi:hypothetical protein